MTENNRYFCQMQSQHVRMRVAHTSATEQIGNRKTFDRDPDQEFESVRARFAANLLKLLLGGDRPLA